MIDSKCVARALVATCLAMAGTAFAQMPEGSAALPSQAKPARPNAGGPNCRPVYPPAALRARAQGDSMLRFGIDAQGKITSTEVIRSAGPTPEHRLLDQAAVEAFSHCRFTPGTGTDGQPIGTQVSITYRWVIDSAKQQ